MKIGITGLTASTITFNEIQGGSGANLNLHGEETAVVEMDTVYKTNEINVLEKAGLIKVENLDPKPEPTPTPVQTPVQTPVPEPTTDPVEEKTEEKTEEKAEKKGPKPVKRGRGRPKGAKNKTKEYPTESSRTIVAGEDGTPVESNMTKTAEIDFEESETTRASIEAMEKLEEDEKAEREVVNTDEKELPINEQMGREATIFTGESSKKVEMKNKMVPESEAAKKADPFIDRDVESETDKLDDETNSFLVDVSDNDPEAPNPDKGGETDDSFIEI
jgi:hypothetical protein